LEHYTSSLARVDFVNRRLVHIPLVCWQVNGVRSVGRGEVCPLHPSLPL
jgi:hypothetical protein